MKLVTGRGCARGVAGMGADGCVPLAGCAVGRGVDDCTSAWLGEYVDSDPGTGPRVDMQPAHTMAPKIAAARRIPQRR